MDNDQDLDDLLKNWSTSRAASPAKLDDLQQRIFADLAAPKPATQSKEANGKIQKSRGWTGLLGAALSMGICFFALWKSPPAVEPPTQTVPAYATLNAVELRNHKVLLRETSQLFDQRLSWLAETRGQVEMGILDRTLQRGSQPISVRLVIEQRRPEETDWSLLCQVDVLAYSEELVQVAPVCEQSAQLTLWSYVLPDGLIAIDTSLSVGEGAITVSTSQLHHDATPLEVSAVQGDQYEFRVFQAASVL